jgi:hypothetical protein
VVEARPAGTRRAGRSYFARATFSDPDGNGWELQEITTRLPAASGRTEMDVAALAELLHETSRRHGAFEAVAPPHDWWDWYAAYMDARQAASDRTTPPRRRPLHGGGQERVVARG